MRYISILLFTLLIQAAYTQAAETYAGKVVAITDGDTIKILTPEKKQIKVRLASIDTPEKSQPYGKRAKQVLSDKIFGKQVDVEKVTTDRYKRMIGKVYLRDRYSLNRHNLQGKSLVSAYFSVYEVKILDLTILHGVLIRTLGMSEKTSDLFQFPGPHPVGHKCN